VVCAGAKRRVRSIGPESFAAAGGRPPGRPRSPTDPGR
jgi:hypothetical protein